MENLIPYQSTKEISYTTHSFGTLTKNSSLSEISPSYDSIRTHKQSGYYSFKKYDTQGGYKVHYLEIDAQGKVIKELIESEGVLPTFLKASDNSIWVSLTSTKLDGIKEILLPLHNRERIQKLKSSREFPGNIVGKLNDQVILHNSDSFSNQKPDRICTLFFDKNHLFKKRKITKLELPSSNKAYLSKTGELHLLSYNFEGSCLIHRQIDLTGNLLHKRTLLTGIHHFGILHLSFTEQSTILVTEGAKLFLMHIHPDGSFSRVELFEDTRTQEYFYNLWEPHQLGENNYFIKFNHDSGKGWMVFNNQKLIEVFLDKEDHTFVNPLTNECIDFGIENPAIGEVIGFSDRQYSLSSYIISSNKTNTDFVILTRTIPDNPRRIKDR